MADLPSQTHYAHPSLIARVSDGMMAVLFAGAGAVTHFAYGSQEFYGENALFEAGQNLLLLSAVVSFFYAASRTLERACHSVLWGLALICTGMLLREIDVRGTGLEPYLGTLFEQHIPYLVLFACSATLLLTLAKDLSNTWRSGLGWLFSLRGAWFVTGIALYLLGDASEKNWFTDKDHLAQMTEESAELLGALFIFCAGYVTIRRQPDATTVQQMPSPGDVQ